MDIVINYWAVIAATVASIALGFAWFGPLFGKQWMHLIGLTKEDVKEGKKRGMHKTYAILAVATFVMAYVMAHSLYYASAVTRIGGVDAGVSAGFWNWLGFMAPVLLGGVLWEGRPWKYWFIVAGYYLVSLMLMGVILAVWQ